MATRTGTTTRCISPDTSLCNASTEETRQAPNAAGTAPVVQVVTEERTPDERRTLPSYRRITLLSGPRDCRPFGVFRQISMDLVLVPDLCVRQHHHGRKEGLSSYRAHLSR